MNKIRAQHGEKFVHLIREKAPYHPSTLVVERADAWNIKLHFLLPKCVAMH